MDNTINVEDKYKSQVYTDGAAEKKSVKENNSRSEAPGDKTVADKVSLSEASKKSQIDAETITGTAEAEKENEIRAERVEAARSEEIYKAEQLEQERSKEIRNAEQLEQVRSEDVRNAEKIERARSEEVRKAESTDRKSAEDVEEKPVEDKVNLSEASKEVKVAEEKVREAGYAEEEDRTKRIEQVKQEVANDKYNVNVDQVAEKMIGVIVSELV